MFDQFMSDALNIAGSSLWSLLMSVFSSKSANSADYFCFYFFVQKKQSMQFLRTLCVFIHANGNEVNEDVFV